MLHVRLFLVLALLGAYAPGQWLNYPTPDLPRTAAGHLHRAEPVGGAAAGPDAVDLPVGQPAQPPLVPGEQVALEAPVQRHGVPLAREGVGALEVCGGVQVGQEN